VEFSFSRLKRLGPDVVGPIEKYQRVQLLIFLLGSTAIVRVRTVEDT
jgi:hypothetical protein